MPCKRHPLMRRTDFCFSYSCYDPHFDRLYTQLEEAGGPCISHTFDHTTERLGLFSGLEIRAADGDCNEAELQMVIWMAASLRKKMELACLASRAVNLPSDDI